MIIVSMQSRERTWYVSRCSAELRIPPMEIILYGRAAKEVI